MNFCDLGLAEPILRAIESEGYQTATPVQAQAIPPALSGRDVLGCAQTGTGKTAAFALPILQRLMNPSTAASNGRRRARALILCPTRELASQIGDAFRAYGKNLRVSRTVIFGGVNQNPQVSDLRRGVDVIIATPGRLLDLMNQGHVDLRGIEVLVLDEADRMLDMGFVHDIRRIAAELPDERQTLMFSATMPGEIRRLAEALLRDPVKIELAPVTATALLIEQSVYMVQRQNKPTLLAHLVKQRSMFRTIVFTRTKHGADRVVRQLDSRGIKAEAIHGNKSQNARQRALANFKASKIPVLVATDIASRGIDVDDVTHVVNYDVTDEPETYVHRIGRTGRAGSAGQAISLCDREEIPNLRAIERLIRKSIAVKTDHPEYINENGPRDHHAPRDQHATNDRHAPRSQHGRPRHASHGPSPRRASAPAATAPKRERSASGQQGRVPSPTPHHSGSSPARAHTPRRHHSRFPLFKR